MEIKAQIAAVIDLDRCTGCRGCDIACKSTWTDRPGIDHAWWIHTEVRPGPEFPTGREDRSGGWVLKRGKLNLSPGPDVSGLLSILHPSELPVLDDYGEPWRFALEEMPAAGSGIAPAPAPIRSTVTQQAIAATVRPDARSGFSARVAAIEASGTFPVPMLCSHCLNPSCVAACPSGAAYKREEDGIVLIDQSRCRGWRSCVPACPYGKVAVNWLSGTSEKCHFCYPLQESGHAPACLSACPTQAIEKGVLLYDADRVEEVASLPEDRLVDGIQEFFLDPANPLVQEQARRCGVAHSTLQDAARSVAYRRLVRDRTALPLRPEFRTVPAVFYLPPLDPRVPEEELARTFTAGHLGPLRRSLDRLRQERRDRRRPEGGSGD